MMNTPAFNDDLLRERRQIPKKKHEQPDTENSTSARQMMNRRGSLRNMAGCAVARR
jgi:hypothetical protein